eukprot:TRINITY_DN1925_c0_g1_i10.p1 TRINITY_DN1925_c0_g1~~TRINITY_DN1925_c0_g1_i10.p1  ORF type:complete len:429 (-),score=88.89 TRINITY_DN1925_c0_g1_i10:1800-2939(-)
MNAANLQKLMQACLLIHQRRNAVLMKDQSSSHHLARMQDKNFRVSTMRGEGIPFMGQDHQFDVMTNPSSIAQPPQPLVPERTQNPTTSISASRVRAVPKPRHMKPGRDEKDRYEIRDSDPTGDILREERMRMSEQMAMVQHSQDPRAQKEQFFLNMDTLMHKLRQITSDNGLDGFTEGVCETLSLAVQEHVRTFLDQLITVSKWRLDLKSEQMQTQTTSTPMADLRRIAMLESQAAERKKKQEKDELAFQAATVRSNRKEELSDEMKMRQDHINRVRSQEEEQRQIESANFAAMAATGLGSIKKRAKSGSSSAIKPVVKDGSSSAPTASFLPPSSVATKNSLRQNRRITLLDVIFLLEQDPRLSRSPLLYFTYYRLRNL